eukprot:3123949-Alexandrium_andersonii.AAC.1
MLSTYRERLFATLRGATCDCKEGQGKAARKYVCARRGCSIKAEGVLEEEYDRLCRRDHADKRMA